MLNNHFSFRIFISDGLINHQRWGKRSYDVTGGTSALWGMWCDALFVLFLFVLCATVYIISSFNPFSHTLCPHQCADCDVRIDGILVCIDCIFVGRCYFFSVWLVCVDLVGLLTLTDTHRTDVDERYFLVWTCYNISFKLYELKDVNSKRMNMFILWLRTTFSALHSN